MGLVQPTVSLAQRYCTVFTNEWRCTDKGIRYTLPLVLLALDYGRNGHFFQPVTRVTKAAAAAAVSTGLLSPLAAAWFSRALISHPCVCNQQGPNVGIHWPRRKPPAARASTWAHEILMVSRPQTKQCRCQLLLIQERTMSAAIRAPLGTSLMKCPPVSPCVLYTTFYSVC